MCRYLHADARFTIEMSYLAAITPFLSGWLIQALMKEGHTLRSFCACPSFAIASVSHRLQSVLNPKFHAWTIATSLQKSFCLTEQDFSILDHSMVLVSLYI